ILTEIQADLSRDSDIKTLLTELVFPVDHIVFASGNAYHGLLQETSETVMDDMISIHVKAPMIISKFLLPAMIKQKYGKIIFITSIWGDVGASNEVVYSTVKGAQNSFVKALAKEVGSSGISVNGVSPGFIDDMISIHVKAPMIISKFLLPAMIKQKYGKIIFITSIWGDVGASNEVVYSTVKGAQNSFVKALAKEVGSSGISVNGVSPGFIDTKMNQHLSSEEREMILAEIPF